MSLESGVVRCLAKAAGRNARGVRRARQSRAGFAFTSRSCHGPVAAFEMMLRSRPVAAADRWRSWVAPLVPPKLNDAQFISNDGTGGAIQVISLPARRRAATTVVSMHRVEYVRWLYRDHFISGEPVNHVALVVPVQ